MWGYSCEQNKHISILSEVDSPVSHGSPLHCKTMICHFGFLRQILLILVFFFFLYLSSDSAYSLFFHCPTFPSILLLNLWQGNIDIDHHSARSFFKILVLSLPLGFPGGVVVNKQPAIAGDVRDTGLIPELGRSARGGPGNPLRYSCQENPVDQRDWRALKTIASQRLRHSWSDLACTRLCLCCMHKLWNLLV